MARKLPQVLGLREGWSFPLVWKQQKKQSFLPQLPARLTIDKWATIWKELSRSNQCRTSSWCSTSKRQLVSAVDSIRLADSDMLGTRWSGVKILQCMTCTRWMIFLQHSYWATFILTCNGNQAQNDWKHNYWASIPNQQHPVEQELVLRRVWEDVSFSNDKTLLWSQIPRWTMTIGAGLFATFPNFHNHHFHPQHPTKDSFSSIARIICWLFRGCRKTTPAQRPLVGVASNACCIHLAQRWGRSVRVMRGR